MDTMKLSFDKIRQLAQQNNAQVELLLTGSESLKFGFQKRQLEKFESTTSAVAGVRVIKNGKQGVSYTENLSEDSLLRTYQDALANAVTLAETAATTEPEIVTMVKPAVQSLPSFANLYQVEDVAMLDKKAKASMFEAAGLDLDKRVHSVPYNGMVETVSWKRILNSEGLDVEFKQKYWTGYTYLLAKENDSSKMRGESVFARSFVELNPMTAAQKAVEKATSSLGAVKLETGMYPVLISRDVMPTFVTMLVDYFSAKSVFEKTSLLENKLNEKIASELVEFIDDPLDENGLGVRPFDGEGARSVVTPLISKGVLKNYLTNSEYAQKMNLPHTASAVRSPQSMMDIGPSTLKMSKGVHSFEEMVKSQPKVLVLTYISGGLHAGFKESTGDFSLPCEGFIYENGKKIKAVDQFVLSGNILTLLQDITMVGNEWNSQGQAIYTPDVFVKSLSVAGA